MTKLRKAINGNNRRLFIKRVSSIAGISMLTDVWSQAEAQDSLVKGGGVQQFELQGDVLLFGYEGRLNAARIDFESASSVLTRIRLSDGAVLSTTLPMAKAHHALKIDADVILCMPQNGSVALLVDAEHRILKTLTSPPGYYYSGHGLVIQSKGVFVLPLCQKVRRDSAATGAVEIYDLQSFRLQNRVEKWGFNPHELLYVAERDEIVVSDYGTLTTFNPPVLSQFGRSSVFTCDPITFDIKRYYDQNDLNGAVTHLRVTPQGYAYFVLQQSVHIDLRRYNNRFSDAVLAAEKDVEALFSLPTRDYPLPYIQYETTEMSVPRPFVRLHLESAERTLIMIEPQYHIRPQSVELNKWTGAVVASYTASDCLIVSDNSGNSSVLDGALLGITEIRGLADISGTPFVAVSGSERNVAIVDVLRKEVVRRYGSENFAAPHMTYHTSIE